MKTISIPAIYLPLSAWDKIEELIIREIYAQKAKQPVDPVRIDGLTRILRKIEGIHEV